MYQNAVFADEGRLDTHLAQLQTVARRLDFQRSSGHEVEAVPIPLGHHDSTSAINGNYHATMVSLMAFASQAPHGPSGHGPSGHTHPAPERPAGTLPRRLQPPAQVR